MRNFLALLLLAVTAIAAPVTAIAAVNLQICTVTPTATDPATSVIGCPKVSIKFAPVAPTTLVRSQVNGAQGWRPFSTLKVADLVNVGGNAPWVPLQGLLVAIQPGSPVTPPVVTPPVVTPPVATQTVVISSVDNPQFAITYQGAAVPACFNVNAKQVCVP